LGASFGAFGSATGAFTTGAGASDLSRSAYPAPSLQPLEVLASETIREDEACSAAVTGASTGLTAARADQLGRGAENAS
jgi:hypothetical protein